MSFKTLLSVATVAIIGFSSTSAFAQRCEDVQLDTVISGSQFGILLRTVDTSCGANGFICVEEVGDLTASQVTQVYASALTAQASDSDITVAWDLGSRGCGNNFPVVTEFRVN